MRTQSLFCFIFFFLCIYASAQNQAAHLAIFKQYYTCGDIDVSGKQITVEALVKLDGTGPYFTGQSANNIVSKHHGAGDANYILRPDHCEISTTLGHYNTKLTLPTFSYDQFYHVAMTYDGAFLRFYVNGCLFDQVAAKGDIQTNNFPTTIGQLASNPTQNSREQLYGFTDEVRVWSVVRTEQEIRDNMLNLPNPTSAVGLLAYYKFEGNTANVQGNSAFDAVPFGAPVLESQEGFKTITRLQANYIIKQPGCQGADGSITVNATGAKSPYLFSINGGPYQTSNIFSNLAPGTYALSVKSDAQSCTKDTTIILNADCPVVSDCNNWLKLPSQPSYVRIGDLDVTGDKITVEATYNLTLPWSGSDLFQGDLVSKHELSGDVNYLLRPSSAEITTSKGYFKTPIVCTPELNKTYHAAMVYDGTTLKFYRNGFLMSSIAASGDLTQNDWQAQIGLYFNGITRENFLGFINEVRIWKAARSQDEIRAFMNRPLSSPQSQPGLLAYYTFDNLLNKQGNAAWDATLGGAASINATNPSCTFVADSCNIFKRNIVKDFQVPDTVCFGDPVKVVNKSDGYSKYYWTTCSGAMSPFPTAVSLANPGGTADRPSHIEMVEEGGLYYGFVVNNLPGSLLRLDYGSSPFNTPMAVSLGNPGNALNSASENHGLQVVQANGSWYLIVVGGIAATPGNSNMLAVIKLGRDITNSTPTGVNYPNLGLLRGADDFEMVNEGGSWYGFAVNGLNNTITRVRFGADLDTPPIVEDLGNRGALSHPTGIKIIDDQGFWRAFITNADGPGSITRLDFGTSIQNTPSGTNLGNPGGHLAAPADLISLRSCETDQLYVLNATGSLVRLVFQDFSAAPQAASLSDIGLKSGSHSISRLVRNGDDLFAMVASTAVDELFALKFAGCISPSNLSSTLTSPPDFKFSTAGPHTISLSLDDGLQSQITLCKTVYVREPMPHTPFSAKQVCSGDSLKIGGQSGMEKYNWSTGATSDSIYVNLPGVYWVASQAHGCSNRDSVQLDLLPRPLLNLGKDTSLCLGDSIKLKNQLGGNYAYSWTPSSFLDRADSESPVAKPLATAQFIATAIGLNNCISRDTVTVAVRQVPKIELGEDSSFCEGSSFTLDSGNPLASIEWSDASTSHSITVRDSGYYSVKVGWQGCVGRDTIHLAFKEKVIFPSIQDQALCEGSSITLGTTALAGYHYSWSPVTGLSTPDKASTAASPAVTTIYTVSAENSAGCSSRQEVEIEVKELPVITLSEDATICEGSSKELQAKGGVSYLWSPSLHLSSANGDHPMAKPINTTVYHVLVTGANQCVNSDSVTVTVQAPPVFAKPSDIKLCSGDTVVLRAEPGYTYHWASSSSLNGGSADSAVVYPVTSSDYELQIQDPVCFNDTTFLIHATVLPLPDVRAFSSNDISCATRFTQLGAQGATSYTWTPSLGLDDQKSSHPKASPSATQTYILEGTNSDRCRNVDSVKVKVQIEGEVKLHIPNAFTPNNDGQNDCFGIPHAENAAGLELTIFDRWGQILFSSDTAGACWDGKFKNIPQPTGVYIYMVTGKIPCGFISMKGTVTLIR